MYLITNRKLTNAKSLKCFGKSPNVKGPNELRLVKVEKSGKGWKVDPVDDQLSKKKVKELILEYKLDIDTDIAWYGT